jgi:hypothetical protein
VTHGPPTTIGWDAMATLRSSVDEYETTRPPRKAQYRLRQSEMERRTILKSEGFVSEEFRIVLEEIKEIKESREKSANEPISSLSSVLAEAKRNKLIHQKKNQPNRRLLLGSGAGGGSLLKRLFRKQSSSSGSLAG